MNGNSIILRAIIIATFSIVLGTTVLTTDQNPIVSGDVGINLVFLGNVDGKSYFADNVLKNWTEAKSYCVSLQMHLATVTTIAQWDILKAAYNNITFTGHYWTSARDAKELRQLSWDINGTEISSTAVPLFGSDFEAFVTCGALYTTSITGLALHLRECTTELAVLCET